MHTHTRMYAITCTHNMCAHIHATQHSVTETHKAFTYYWLHVVCVSVAQYGCVHQTSFSSCQQSVWTTTCHSSSSSPFSSQSCRWASFTIGRVRTLPSTARVSSHKLMWTCACVLWLPHPVRLQQLQEQCYPFLAVGVCAQCFHVSRQSACDFQRAHNCWCVWLCKRSANTLKVDWEKNPFPLVWIRLQLVLHLAFWPDASAEQRLFPKMFSSCLHDGWFMALDAAVGCRSWVKFRLTVYCWFFYLFLNSN